VQHSQSTKKERGSTKTVRKAALYDLQQNKKLDITGFVKLAQF